MEQFKNELILYHKQYKLLKKNGCVEQKKWRDIWLACNSIEKRVDDVELFVIKDAVVRENEHIQRKLILRRLNELRKKALCRYNKK